MLVDLGGRTERTDAKAALPKHLAIVDQREADAGDFELLAAGLDEIGEQLDAFGREFVRGLARERLAFETGRAKALRNHRHRGRALGRCARAAINDQYGPRSPFAQRARRPAGAFAGQCFISEADAFLPTVARRGGGAVAHFGHGAGADDRPRFRDGVLGVGGATDIGDDNAQVTLG